MINAFFFAILLDKAKDPADVTLSFISILSFTTILIKSSLSEDSYISISELFKSASIKVVIQKEIKIYSLKIIMHLFILIKSINLLRII